MQTFLWIAQRGSGALLAVFVVIHLATIIYAVQGGLSGQEILGRVRGSAAWLTFYALFVVAVTLHAPIGLRAVFAELTPLPSRLVNGLSGLLGLSLLGLGLHAAWALFAAPVG